MDPHPRRRARRAAPPGLGPRSVRRWERDIEKASVEFTALHGRHPSSEELSEAIGCTVRELRQRIEEISRSDLTSLNTVVLSDDETTIERMDTLASTDERLDPEHAAQADRREGALPRGVRQAAAP